MDRLELLELAGPHYSQPQLDTLGRAIDFAAAKHDKQVRMSGEVFLTHPLAVAAILVDWRLDIDSVLAGVLHDTLEDTSTELSEIEHVFGADVAQLVDGVSKVSRARAGMGNLEGYRQATKDNLSKFLIALSQDLRVLMIKLADRLHNLRTLEHLPPPRRLKVAQESLQVFAPLADRLGMGRVKIEIEELAFKWLEPKQYQHLQSLIKKKVGRAQKQLEVVRREVAAQLKQSGLEFDIDARIKSTFSLHKKLKKAEVEQVYDLMAIRIVVDSKEECYRVLGILHALYQPMIKKIKDYISVPKPNGYQSLHTTVITPGKQIIEFQIRTHDMHEYAERGLAATFHYNEQKLSKNYIKKRTAELPRNLLWILDLQELAHKVLAGEVPPGGLQLDLFSDRIFVYSPKGDIFDLPEGSTVLDFAYAVHSSIGHHAYGGKINGRIGKLSAPLKNGDVVEVTTRSNIHPNQRWLEHVHTAKARQKIKAYLNQAT